MHSAGITRNPRFSVGHGCSQALAWRSVRQRISARSRAVERSSNNVERVHYHQQLLIALNREVARQLLQGPLHSFTASDLSAVPEPDVDQLEAQDDLERLAATLAPDAPTAASSTAVQEHALLSTDVTMQEAGPMDNSRRVAIDNVTDEKGKK